MVGQTNWSGDFRTVELQKCGLLYLSEYKISIRYQCVSATPSPRPFCRFACGEWRNHVMFSDECRQELQFVAFVI